jgi:uncharacterized repeat protein (TIGR02543 family)
MMKHRFLLSILTTTAIFLSSCGGESSPVEYNVYFFTANTNATIIPTLFDYTPGTLLDEPETPVRPGFEFGGWFTDIVYASPWDFETDVMPEASFVLYAKWLAETKTITYHLNGGEMTTQDYVTEFVPGTSIVLPRARKTGHIFKGWFLYEQDFVTYPNSGGTKPGDQQVISISRTMVTDIDLFAHWTIIEAVVTFRANHPNGTTAVANPTTRRITYGTIIEFGTNFPADFGTVEGYVFIGWNTRADGTGDWFVNGSVFTRTATTTIHGQWQPAA